MFKKIIELKNKGAKASAILSLVGGAVAYIAAGGGNIPYPWVLQTAGVALFTYSIYIATAYLFKRHTVVIEPAGEPDEDGESGYNLLIFEMTGKRERKVCDVPTSRVDFVRVVTAENKKEVARDRKNKDKYTYDAQFAAQRRIEIAITSGGEVASILLTYDEDVLNALLSAGVTKL